MFFFILLGCCKINCEAWNVLQREDRPCQTDAHKNNCRGIKTSSKPFVRGRDKHWFVANQLGCPSLSREPWERDAVQTQAFIWARAPAGSIRPTLKQLIATKCRQSPMRSASEMQSAVGRGLYTNFYIPFHASSKIPVSLHSHFNRFNNISTFLKHFFSFFISKSLFKIVDMFIDRLLLTENQILLLF